MIFIYRYSAEHRLLPTYFTVWEFVSE